EIAAIVALQEEDYIPLDSLRAVEAGGSMVHSPLFTRMRTLLCPNIYCTYSASEVGNVAYAHVSTIHGVDHAAGYVLPWADVEIVDANRTPLVAGEEGEIRIRTLGQRYRYHKLSETEYRLDRSEWFYPGDRGILLRNGLLLVLGRIHDIINRGGVKVAPDRIENALMEHPAIADAVAVGVMDEIGVEQIWAAIVAR